jgi:hypothetical protein
MYAIHGLTRGIRVCAADGMVEEDNFVGVGDVLEEEGFDFWVVYFADGGF